MCLSHIRQSDQLPLLKLRNVGSFRCFAVHIQSEADLNHVTSSRDIRSSLVTTYFIMGARWPTLNAPREYFVSNSVTSHAVTLSLFVLCLSMH